MTRKERNRIHLIADVDEVHCPYCGKGGFKMLHWNHLKTHNKTTKDLRKDFPSVPTMTLNESRRREKARLKCEHKVRKTCIERYGGVGYESKKLFKLSEKTTEEKFGHVNIMKTDHGTKYFKGVERPPEVRKKISEGNKGQPSPHKGRTYEEILGPDRAEIRKEELRYSGAYGQSVSPRISGPQLQLYSMIEKIYPTAILEYPIFGFCIDIAIPEKKLAIEYDGSYWHNEDNDKKRDEILESLGWRVIRFIDIVPTMKELRDSLSD